MLATVELTGTALGFAVISGIVLGVLSARRAGGPFDRAVRALATAGYALPEFWVGQLLILAFAIRLGWLPSQGNHSVRGAPPGWAGFVESLRYLVLPAFALSLRYIALIARITRSAMLEVLGAEFVLAARLRGASERAVLLGHVLRNAAAPVITVIGYNLGFILAGSALIETVFGWPGIGRLLFDSIGSRDYPTMMGILLLVSVTVVLANLATDIVHRLLDPRRAMRRLRPGAAIALGFLVLVLLTAIFAPVVAGHDPYAGGEDALLPPLSPGHVLGTDDLGRDIWAETAYGTRVSLAVGISTALAGALIGVAVGAASGWRGGAADTVLMRVTEFFQTLPRFVLALIVVALFGPGILKVILVIAILAWPQTARVVRASVASLRTAPFVDAARLGGMPARALVLREILPNVAAPVIVLASLDVATAILLEAGLGFFGLGDPNFVSWGSMLNEAQQYLRSAWWMAVFPGVAIAATVLAFNTLGDALNAAANPRGER